MTLVLVIGCIFGVAYPKKHTAKNTVSAPPVQTVQREVVSTSTDTPSEDRPTDYQWHGQSADPQKISLPTIQTEAYLQAVGLDQDSKIAVPTNIFLAGWFVDSVQPGELGLSIIDGHVIGHYNDGIFKNLNKLAIGDTFTVTRGDGKILSYTVKVIQSVPNEQANEVLFSQLPDIKSQLNLITCDGEYVREIQQYGKRLIISAELEQ